LTPATGFGTPATGFGVDPASGTARRAAPGALGDHSARMLQLALCAAPGWRTTRSVPELNASGGQVIGSTARPPRLVAGSAVSAVCTCTHGQESSHTIATPVPSVRRSRT